MTPKKKKSAKNRGEFSPMRARLLPPPLLLLHACRKKLADLTALFLPKLLPPTSVESKSKGM